MRSIDNATQRPGIAARRGRTAPTSWRAALIAALRTVATRPRLHDLDGRMLADVGLSRAEALREAERAPWDLAPVRRGRTGSAGWPR